MNSNSEEAESNREIKYLTAAHGNMKERRKREKEGEVIVNIT